MTVTSDVDQLLVRTGLRDARDRQPGRRGTKDVDDRRRGHHTELARDNPLEEALPAVGIVAHPAPVYQFCQDAPSRRYSATS